MCGPVLHSIGHHARGQRGPSIGGSRDEQSETRSTQSTTSTSLGSTDTDNETSMSQSMGCFPRKNLSTPSSRRARIFASFDGQTALQSFDQQTSERIAPRMERVHSLGSKQRKLVRIFPRGSFVEIYSGSQQQWFADGEVVEVIWESAFRDGVPVRAGSSKIVYGHGKHFKWVASQSLHDTVRRSNRPQQPEPLFGHVMTEASSWLGTWWRWSHFQLCQGVLQWWDEEAEAAAGAKPAGSITLLGLQLQKDGLCVRLRTKHTEGAAFKAQSEEYENTFMDALCLHADYCEEDKLFLASQASSM